MTKYLLLLPIFLIVFLLNAQENNWQKFIYLDKHTEKKTVEFQGSLWITDYETLVQYEHGSNEPKIFSSADLGLYYGINDIYVSDDNFLFLLDGTKKIYIRQDDQWQLWGAVTQAFPPFLDEVNVSNIIGGDAQGLIIHTNEGHVLKLLQDGTMASFGNYYFDPVRYFELEMLGDNKICGWGGHFIKVMNENGDVLFDITNFSDYITDVQVTDDGAIWFFSEFGAFYWSQETTHLIYKYFSSPALEKGQFQHAYLYNNNVLVVTDNSVLEFSIENDIISFEDLSGQFENKDFPIYHGMVDRNNRLWYFNKKTGELMYWEKGKKPASIYYKPWIDTKNIRKITQDREGLIWVLGNSTISYYLGGRWTLLDMEKVPGNQFFKDIAFTDKNELILLSQPNRLDTLVNVLRRKGETWDTLGQLVSQRNTPIFAHNLEIDQDQNIWFAGATFVSIGGFTPLFIYNEGRWFQRLLKDMPLNTATGISCISQAPDGRMWLGTDLGIMSYNGFDFINIDTTGLSIEPINWISDIAFDKDENAWITLGWQGIFKREGGQWINFKPGAELLANQNVYRIIQGNNDDMWATGNGTDGLPGVLHFDGNNWELWNSANSGIEDAAIRSLFKDKNNRIWFASFRNLSVLSPKEKEVPIFSLNNTQNMAVYPNPGCCRYRVHWHQNELASSQLRIINPQGQIMKQWLFEKRDVGDYEHEFIQDNLPAGSYYIQLLVNQKQVESLSLIIVN